MTCHDSRMVLEGFFGNSFFGGIPDSRLFLGVRNSREFPFPDSRHFLKGHNPSVRQRWELAEPNGSKGPEDKFISKNALSAVLSTEGRVVGPCWEKSKYE